MKIGAPKSKIYSINKLMTCLYLVVVGLGTACQAEKTSHLAPVEGDPGVFRYVEGDGSIAAVTLSAKKSVRQGRFVVFVATTDKQADQAVAHAKKLSEWFENSIDGVQQVPVVIYLNDKGVGYTYHISGQPYWHDVHSPKGTMTPQQSVDALKDAVVTYKAREVMRERGEFDALLN